MATKRVPKRKRPADDIESFRVPIEQRKGDDGTTQTAQDKSTFRDQSTSSELVLPEPQRLYYDYRLP